MRMKKTAAALGMAAALLLAGCASASPATSAPEAPETTPTLTPEASPTGLPAVSLETTCTFLFGTDLDGPLTVATDIILQVAENPVLSKLDRTELDDTIGDLERASKNAADDVKPYIDAAAAPLQTMARALDGSGEDELSFDDFKVAGTELINQCHPYLED